jgi:hypothetical protein
MKDLSLEELELLDGALNAYRETLTKFESNYIQILEEVQNTIREEWRYIKGWDI